MSKTKNRVKKKKQMSLVPIKQQEKSLVVVEKKKLQIATIYQKEVFKKIVKGMSLALIGTISVAYIALMVIVATSIFYVSHLQNGLIQKGVYVNGISVSNLKEEEALQSLGAQLNDAMPEAITLKYKDTNYLLNLRELQVAFDVETAVTEAYSIGRTQNVVKDLKEYVKVMNDTVNIDSELQYNDEILNQFLAKTAEQMPDKVQEYTYRVEKDKLIIDSGKSGVELEKEELKKRILANLKERKYDEIIDIPTVETLPKAINLQEIHDAVYREPQNAYYTENPITIHEQIVGIDFDVPSAQKQIDILPISEQYRIDLKLTNPSILVKDLNVFPDTLSTFSTNYVNNPNRTTNLILAANKINGTVLMPGETFSFNKVVGERTIAAGYKNAAIFVNGEVEDGLAGGICQISSTLYDAVIGANLKIKERHNHSKLTSYLAGGKDATVVWKRYDFQFVNNREYPIKVEMSVQNGKATANILGIRSAEEYEITIESQRVGVSGAYTVYNAYKVYRQNGVEVKREFLSRDLYK